MSFKIFFSHSGQDESWVKQIANQAKVVGVEVYTYEHDQQPGRLLAEKLKEQISTCDALVVLLSKNGSTSPYVQQEIGFAEAKGKLVVPLVTPDVKTGIAMLEGREYLAFNPEDPGPTMAHLVQYLSKLKTQKDNIQGVAILVCLIIGLVWLGRSS